MKNLGSINIFLFLSLFNAGLVAQTADDIFYNGTIYTVDSSFSVKSAIAVKDGKIISSGTDAEILKLSAKHRTDLRGKFVYPGFQDAHCHFYGYGYDLVKIWLTATPSWNAALDTVLKYNHKRIGGWIFGRGWDQNDWANHVYPDKTELDSLFPDIPVFLLRIDGHAALVNQVALDRAGITNETTIKGGEIEIKNGKLTGILIDNAVDIVYRIIPHSSVNEQITALINAQKNCFAKGLTSVTDAGYENTGLRLALIRLIDSLQKSDDLKMRINAMAAMEDYDWFANNGKIINPNLKVQSFKLYADGSLGSRGACLLQPYEDKPGHHGFLFYSPEQLDSLARKVTEIEFQLNTHCIGDSSHRVMLKIYEKYIPGLNDPRWRIEHAQVINPSDLIYYGRNRIIPSVQPVHATSDMYWAQKRLGPERMKGAYAYKDLMNQNNLIAAGSDFPVEDINPLFGFYAAVSRKDHKNFPESGFLMENALTREQALKAMTIWSAYASFSEKETGSLEKGKFADFVILDEDLMTIREENIWKVKVLATYINGETVYEMR